MREIFFSRTAGAIATWLTLATASFAVLAYLTPEWFGQLSWPQAILLGIAGMLATSLVLAAAVFVFAIGYRRLRPLPQPNEPSPAATLINTREKEKISDLRRRVKQLEDAGKGLEAPDDEAEWKPMSIAQRERVSVALADVEDFLRDRYPAFADGALLDKFRKVIMREGPEPLRVAIEEFALSVEPFGSEFNALITRHDTELKIAGLDLHRLLFQTTALGRRALEASELLARAPSETRDPEFLEPHVMKIGQPVSAARKAAQEMLDAVKGKRITLARGTA